MENSKLTEESLRKQVAELQHKCAQSEQTLTSARTSNQEKLTKKLQDADGKAEATGQEVHRLREELKVVKEL